MRMIDLSHFGDRQPRTQTLFSPDSRQVARWGLAARTHAAAELIGLVDDLDNVPLYPPSSDEAWALHAVAWDVSGQSRAALWWKAAQSEMGPADVVEVRSSLDGRVLWQIQGDGLYAERGSSSAGLPHLQLHLYADTVRLLDRAGLHQVHRSGYRTFQAYDDTANLCLTALSGEVCALRDVPLPAQTSPDGRFRLENGLIVVVDGPQRLITLPTLCVPASRRHGLQTLYGLWLSEQQQYVQDHAGQPLTYATQQQAVNALTAQGFRLGPVEIRSLPAAPASRTGAGVVPQWMLGKQMPTPPGLSVERAAPMDLGVFTRALEQQGWPVETEGSLCTAVELPEGVVVAEVLQRPEGTCALMTAWRGLWPARWEVWLSGTLEHAAGQIERALGEGPQRLHQMPAEQCSSRLHTSPALGRSNDELVALLTGDDGDEAALAEVILWARFQHLSMVLPHLQAPPEPDWNRFGMLWIDGLLPAWAIRPVWRTVPLWVQRDLVGELQEEFESDETWGAWCHTA